MYTPPTNRKADSTVGTEAVIQPTADGRAVDTCQFAPFNQQLGLPQGGDVVITTGVARLNAPSVPRYVAFFVVSVIVNAVDGQFVRRAVSDFSIKFLKRIKTELYASTPVVRIVFVLRVLATLFSIAVNAISRCFGHPVSRATFLNCIPNQTAARLRMPPPQEIGSDYRELSTITFTQPLSLLTFAVAGEAYYVQFTESLVAKISSARTGVFFVRLISRHLFKTSFLNNLSSRAIEGFRFLLPAQLLYQNTLIISS